MFCTQCGLELPDDSKFCRKCGYAFPITESQALAATPENGQEPPRVATGLLAASTATQPSLNFGTFVFAGFSVLSLIVCVAKGIVPIYLGEAALWAALAWFWYRKNPTSQLLNAGIVLLAVVVAAGQGFIIGSKPIQSQTSDIWQSAERLNSSQNKPHVKSPLDTHRLSLAYLGPQKLIQSCGKPLNDKRLERSNKALGISLVARQLSYNGMDNSVITFTFLKRQGNEFLDSTWMMPSMDNGTRDYSMISDSDVELLFSELPCIPE